MRSDVYKLGLSILVSLGLSFSAHARSLPNHGPQIRVAVSQFGATDKFAASYGGWDVGGGLAAQLVTSLIDSDRVVVVERAVLSKVLMEQELGQNRLSSPLTKVPAGNLLGVDYLIVGQVTEFEDQQLTGGAAVAVLKGFGPKISSDVTMAHVGIDMRIIDTRTGEILHSHRAQGKAWGQTLGIKFTTGLIDFGGELFYKTPLGKATRRAINSALEFILSAVEQQTREFKWLARVIDTEGPFIYVDAGKLQNVVLGDFLNVVAIDKVLTDPETNEVIGLVETETSTAQVVKVETKYAKARVVAGEFPGKGFLVRFADDMHKETLSRKQPAGYQIME